MFHFMENNTLQNLKNKNDSNSLTMKLNMLLLLFSIGTIFSSCVDKKNVPEAPKVVSKSASLIIGNPLDCGVENISFFPVGTNYKPKIYEGGEVTKVLKEAVLNFSLNSRGSYNDVSAESEYINGNENEFDIRNILFYDRKSGLTYPLVSDTVHILSFAIHKEFPKPMIFYRIVKKDINVDSVYNSQDAIMLFISDIFGKNMTQVTPDDEQFLEYSYYPETQKILIKSAIDRDGNKEFSSSDETNFRDMNINEPKMGREIFSTSLKDSLRFQ